MTNKPNPSFDFVLPYDFIEIEPTKPGYSYKERGPLSGEIVVRMETKSPLVAIKATEKNENVKVLPASSIRGMLRNAAEIIWDEAINYNLPKRRHKDGYKQKEAEMLDENIPRHIRIDGNENLKATKHAQKGHVVPAETVSAHRLGSHLFGFALTSSRKGDDATSLASALTFTDAHAKVNYVVMMPAYIRPQRLGEPQFVIRKVFNRQAKGSLLNVKYLNKSKKAVVGRKVYLNGKLFELKKNLFAAKVDKPFEQYVQVSQRDVDNQKNLDPRKRAVPIKLIAPGTIYEFKIQFKRLDEQQLAELVKVIELDGVATHALGRGKPFGLGRVQLKVQHVQVQNQASFFDLTKPSYAEVLSIDALRNMPTQFEKKLSRFIEVAHPSMFDGKKRYVMPDGSSGKITQYLRKKYDY